MSLLTNAPALRRRACALALPGIPLALLLGTLISPTDSTDNAPQLRAAAAHGGRWEAAALLELLAAALFPLAVGGIVHLVRRRGSGLANLGALLGGLGTIGLAAIAFRHLFIYGLAGIDHAAALHALDRVDNTVGIVMLPCMFAGPLALITISGAASRAGYVSRWVVAGAIVFFISDSLPIPGAEILQAAVGLATFGWIALQMLRLTNEQWEMPEAPAAVEAGRRVSPVAAHAET
jgi:hypothetical protein